MNWDRVERRFLGMVIVLIFCGTHRDYGPFGQLAVLFGVLAYAIYAEWMMAKEHRATSSNGE